MIAYKGFNKNLQCTLGNGTFQYEIGQTYKEETAKCASTGFHCVERPIDVLNWYHNKDSRFCIVEISGDIHEDGNDKISATEMKLLKEVTLQQLLALECQWQYQRPERDFDNSHIRAEKGEVCGELQFIMVRGKHPIAKGPKGSTLYLIQESEDGKSIENIGIFEIDGEEYKPNTYYSVKGRKVNAKRNAKKA